MPIYHQAFRARACAYAQYILVGKMKYLKIACNILNYLYYVYFVSEEDVLIKKRIFFFRFITRAYFKRRRICYLGEKRLLIKLAILSRFFIVSWPLVQLNWTVKLHWMNKCLTLKVQKIKLPFFGILKTYYFCFIYWKIWHSALLGGYTCLS